MPAMKAKILTILLSINLLFLGCSSKSVSLDTPSQQAQGTPTDTAEDSSMGEKVLVGSLLVGAAALFLTTAAVVILLLVPKAQVSGSGTR
jgi:hypothetical protein